MQNIQPATTDFRRMLPAQLLQALFPIPEMGLQSAESGAPLTGVLRETVLAGYLAGGGLAPHRAVELARQLRWAARGRELTPPYPRPGLPLMQAPEPQGVRPGTLPGIPLLPPLQDYMTLEMQPQALQPAVLQMPELEPPAAEEPQLEARPPLNGMQGLPRGSYDQATLILAIRQAMGDQASAVVFYSQLMEQLSDPALKDYVRAARDDEMKHLRMLENLHQTLTGEPFEAEAQPTEFANLREGLKKAMDAEYEAFEFYRAIFLKYGSMKPVHDVFFELLTDELEHASRFNYVLQSL